VSRIAHPERLGVAFGGRKKNKKVWWGKGDMGKKLGRAELYNGLKTAQESGVGSGGDAGAKKAEKGE